MYLKYSASAEEVSRSKLEALLLEERIEKIRKKNEEIKKRHLVRFSCLPVDVKEERGRCIIGALECRV
jgi:hypothetical protein